MKQYINKRDIVLIGITLTLGLAIGWLLFYSPDKKTTSHHKEQASAEETIWTCSMHPQIKQPKPGSCPICAMDLVPTKTDVKEGDHVDPNEIQMTKSALALASVQTTFVTKRKPENNIHLLGKVKADERNISEITARFGGRIEKLYINYTGQQVKKGQKLGTIYSPDLITAQKELLEAIKYKSSKPSFYKVARTKLKLWNLTQQQIDEIETSGKSKTYIEILSSITGTVTQRHVAIGDYVKEGSALFKVINLSKVWVIFDAYESDLPWIKVGDMIDFTIQSVPDETFVGKVTYIAPFINAQTRVAQVRVELNNQKKKLKPEMFVNGTLKSSIAQNAKVMLIPKSSILWTGKRAVVYVKVPQRKTTSFIYREVNLGAEAGDFYVVIDGLSEGEEIVTNGAFKIDAAAQLAGKSSMMNPHGGHISTGHNHGEMSMDKDNKHEEHDMNTANLKHEIFRVSGNCEMCKSTIETAAKSLPGVNEASWNLKTKMLHISFDEAQSSLSEIHQTIAQSGYDTELVIAPQNAYNKLPACCQYTRAAATTHKIQHE